MSAVDTENENDFSNKGPAMVKVASGHVKTEKMEPVFRIVEGDKQNVKVNIPKVNITSEEESRQRGDLFAEATGPCWYKMSNPMITPPIIGSNLWLQFKGLPIAGAPECAAKLEDYEEAKLREYVGDMSDDDYEELKNYCDPDNLKTGKELKMSTNYPIIGLLSRNIANEDTSDEEQTETEAADKQPKTDLCILKRCKKRMKHVSRNILVKQLKYRGVKHFPIREQEHNNPGMELEAANLKPGKDVLYRIRVMRPFSMRHILDKKIRGRHSVLNCDIMIPGQLPLSTLRDRFACWNDLDMRLDKSHGPDDQPFASAKAVFPSGFLFINNVFYVDGREGCTDTSAPVRRWAQQRGLGVFPVRPMETTCLNDTLVRLGHPEVYVHQGSCEHVFVFSEIRLLNRSDPLLLSAYPCHTLSSQNQSIYCTSCADYLAKWLVTGTNRVPFDPAFFCEACFKQYMYVDGKKIGDFKAYAYRGNELIVKNPPR